MIHKQQLHFTARRAASPLASIDLNNSVRLVRQSFINSPPSQEPRLKKNLTYSENTSKNHFVNMSCKENVGPQGRPRFTFSVRSTRMSNKPRNGNINLNNSCSLGGQIKAQRSLSINPFILSLPEVEQIQFKEEMGINDFMKLKELGKGKFGTVWLAIHKKTKFVCALKRISKQVVRQEKVQHQVAKQLRIHNSLRHKNIISFYGYFTDKDYFYIVSQFATDGHLFGQLKKHHRLEEQTVKEYTLQTAEGIMSIHNHGFIHRDLKPQNILLQFGVVKICDFGWAAECWEHTMRQSQCGTPLYYSPELVRKEGHNQRLDIWSLGLLVYELMVGRVPFKIWSEFDLHLILQETVSIPYYVDATDDLKDFVMKCLQKEQNARPSLKYLLQHKWLRSVPTKDPETQLYIQLQGLL